MEKRGGKAYVPRKARTESDALFFHVMVQGINKEYIFEQRNLKTKYLNLLKHSKEFNIGLIAYCIMDNHSHMLFQVKNPQDMAELMKKINQEFAVYYNWKNDRVGVVFRNRYRSEPIYNEKSLRNCIAYIHNNPVKARMVAKPENYEFSSYQNYMNGCIEKSIFDITFDSNIDFFKKVHEEEKNCGSLGNIFLENVGDKVDVIKAKKKLMEERGITEIEFKKDKKLAKEMMVQIKEISNAPNKEIASQIGVSATTVANCLKKSMKN